LRMTPVNNPAQSAAKFQNGKMQSLFIEYRMHWYYPEMQHTHNLKLRSRQY
jgi:hypothetical protein